jgi:hypothetical protein
LRKRKIFFFNFIVESLHFLKRIQYLHCNMNSDISILDDLSYPSMSVHDDLADFLHCPPQIDLGQLADLQEDGAVITDHLLVVRADVLTEKQIFVDQLRLPPRINDTHQRAKHHEGVHQVSDRTHRAGCDEPRGEAKGRMIWDYGNCILFFEFRIGSFCKYWLIVPCCVRH